MEPINCRQGGRPSEDRVRIILSNGKYYTNHPLLRGPFDSPRDAYRTVRNRTQGKLPASCLLRRLRARLHRSHRAGSPPAPLSEKLEPAVAESASALTLQETDVSSLVETDVSSLVETDVPSLVESFDTTSLEEPITASPGIVPHNSIDSSLSSSEFSCQKFVVPSAKRDVSSSEELLDATSTEETIIAIPEILPHRTIDGSSSFFPFSCEKLVAGIPESASLQTLHEPEVASLNTFHDSASSEGLVTASSQAGRPGPIEGSSGTFPLTCEKLVAGAAESASMSSEVSISASPESVLDNTTDCSPPSASSLGSKILSRSPKNWYQVFYIRMDHGGSFCMYPNLGGPFQSIDEADDAINHYLDGLRSKAICKEQEKLSAVDRMIHKVKHYLDGTPKRGPNSPRENEKFYLIQAILHQYNEENNLIGNCAHELEALVGQQLIYEDHRWYFHFNFSVKKKDGVDNSSTDSLFFAEVSYMQGEEVLEVNCCCMIKLEENGHCYGCQNNGSHNLKHPNNIGKYTGGHLDGYLPFGCEDASSDEEAEEERLRTMFEGLDDPNYFDRIRQLTPKFSAKRIMV